MAKVQRKWILRVAVVTALVAILSPTFGARADEHHRDRDGHWWRHGDIRRFKEVDIHRWRSGHWVHARHGGRFGWWWVVGGVWYFYPAPVYSHLNPYIPPVVVATPGPPPPPQASPQYWYYCNSAGGYYPYVTSCPEGWMQVVPQP